MTDLEGTVEIKEETISFPIIETTSNIQPLSTSLKRRINSEKEESSVIKFVDYIDLNLDTNLPKKAKNIVNSRTVEFKIQSVESLVSQKGFKKSKSDQSKKLSPKKAIKKTKTVEALNAASIKSENDDISSGVTQINEQEFIKTECEIKTEESAVNQESFEDSQIAINTFDQQPKDEFDTEIIKYVPHLSEPSTSSNQNQPTVKAKPNKESSSDPDYTQDDDDSHESNDLKINYILSKGFYLCIHCNISFKRLYNFERHECLICRTCNKLFTSTTTLKRHIQNVHTITDEKFECKECNKTFKAKVYLETHINSHEKKYECESCGKKFGSISRLNEHKIKHIAPEKLICSVCDAKLATRSSLKFHMRTHDAERVKHLQCNECDFTTDDNRTLVKHQQSHQRKEEKYKTLTEFVQCEKCPAKLKNIMSLKNHMYYVHSNLSFQCKICHVVLKSERNLKRHHISVHTGVHMKMKTEMK